MWKLRVRPALVHMSPNPLSPVHTRSSSPSVENLGDTVHGLYSLGYGLVAALFSIGVPEAILHMLAGKGGGKALMAWQKGHKSIHRPGTEQRNVSWPCLRLTISQCWAQHSSSCLPGFSLVDTSVARRRGWHQESRHLLLRRMRVSWKEYHGFEGSKDLGWNYSPTY